MNAICAKAHEYVHKAKGGWVFREPGYTRWDGDRLIETVEHQDFWYEKEAEALGHADWYLHPPNVWFPPPPM